MLKDLDQESYEGARDESRRKCLEHGVGGFSVDELDLRAKEDGNMYSLLQEYIEDYLEMVMESLK